MSNFSECRPGQFVESYAGIAAVRLMKAFSVLEDLRAECALREPQKKHAEAIVRSTLQIVEKAAIVCHRIGYNSYFFGEGGGV